MDDSIPGNPIQSVPSPVWQLYATARPAVLLSLGRCDTHPCLGVLISCKCSTRPFLLVSSPLSFRASEQLMEADGPGQRSWGRQEQWQGPLKG